MRRRGFTLVELLVVIAIFGLLSSVVFAIVRGAMEEARDARKIESLNQVQKAIQVYYSKYEYYPNVSQGGSCVVETCKNGDGWDALKTILQDEDLMSGLPSKDEGYIYCSDKTSNSQEYVLKVLLGTDHQILTNAVDFDGTFFTSWSCDDIGCSDGTKAFCLIHCENVIGQEGPADNSMYPPNCGTY